MEPLQLKQRFNAPACLQNELKDIYVILYQQTWKAFHFSPFCFFDFFIFQFNTNQYHQSRSSHIHLILSLETICSKNNQVNQQLTYINLINIPINSISFHCLLIRLLLSHFKPPMPAKLKVKDPHPKLETSARQQDQPRRSQRVKDLPKNDYLMMGMGNIQQGYGLDFSDDDYRPKRIRRNFREDDSYDYQGNGKRPRKKIHMLNRVQTLLEWKNNVRQPQILADGDAKCYSVKKLPTQNLEKYGKNIQALFINIAWGEKGQNMEDFIKLKIDNNAFMRKGIVFVWTPKQHFASIMDIMEKKGFTYVENFQIIYMSKQKALQNIAQGKKTIPDDSSNSVELKKRMTRSDKVQQQQETNEKVLISQLIDTNPVQLIQQQPSNFFNMSKKTLLMFRKVSEQRIQLRHQRTCDVIFDMPSKNFGQCTGDLKDYVYKMIETLLPKCFAKFQPGYQSKRDQTLKMVELWGEPNHLRKGWINISEK